MKAPWFLKLSSALLHQGLALLVLVLLLREPAYDGWGDIYAWMSFTVPLVIGLALGGPAVLSLVSRLRGAGRVLGLLLAAGSLAGSWTGVAYLLLSHSLYDFNSSIFYAWLAGSLGQLVLLSWYLPAPTALPPLGWQLLGLLRLAWAGVVLAGLLLLTTYRAAPRRSLYLIPAGFQGECRVVYGQPGGTTPLLEQGRPVLRIPADGVLLVTLPYQAGFFENEYYWVDPAGHREKMAELLPFPNSRVKQTGALPSGAALVLGAMPDGSFSGESPLAAPYTILLVFNKHQNPDTLAAPAEVSEQRRRQLDSLMQAKILAGRARQSAARN